MSNISFEGRRVSRHNAQEIINGSFSCFLKISSILVKYTIEICGLSFCSFKNQDPFSFFLLAQGIMNVSSFTCFF